MALWTVNATGDIAVGTTAITILGVDAPASAVVKLRGVHLNFESATATDGLALIEIIRAAEEGTASSLTPVSVDGCHTASASFGAFHTHTVEPSTPTVVAAYQYPVQGAVDIPLPFTEPIRSAVAGFLGIRVTTPQAQNCRGHLVVED